MPVNAEYREYVLEQLACLGSEVSAELLEDAGQLRAWGRAAVEVARRSSKPARTVNRTVKRGGTK